MPSPKRPDSRCYSRGGFRKDRYTGDNGAPNGGIARRKPAKKLHQRLTQDLAEDRALISDRRDLTPPLGILEKPATIGPEIPLVIDIAQSSDSKKERQIVPIEGNLPEESLELAARYARPVVPLKGPPNENRPRYKLTDLKNGFSRDPDNFYELKYRPTLREMVAVGSARKAQFSWNCSSRE
jgi:hypothetical protein